MPAQTQALATAGPAATAQLLTFPLTHQAAGAVPPAPAAANPNAAPATQRPQRTWTLAEVSKFCDIKPHNIRYWLGEVLPPRFRAPGRGERGYCTQAVEFVLLVKALHVTQGLTLEGVRKRLSLMDDVELRAHARRAFLATLRGELESVLAMLSSPQPGAPDRAG